jgi:hypothetical protein
MMDNETSVPSTEETVETTAVLSEGEVKKTTETTSETETAPVAVSEQPEEEVKTPRAEVRIHELSKRLKESEQKAEYWEKLNAPPVAPADVPDGDTYSAEQIADVIMAKQQAQQVESNKTEANKELQRDILETLQKHPDLDTNDKLSRTVFNYAQANNMRIIDAADEVKSQIKAEAEKVRKEVLASQSGRVGVTTPSGGKVSSGEETIDINSLSEEEKSANWGKILQSYQK